MESAKTDEGTVYVLNQDSASLADPDAFMEYVRENEAYELMDRRANKMLDADAVRAKYGVVPALIPDYLALVGDAADGYPGISGIGAVSAARMLNQYGQIEAFPENVLGAQREQALLFKKLATLESAAKLFRDVDTLRWRGPTDAFAAWAERLAAPRLLERCLKVQASMQK